MICPRCQQPNPDNTEYCLYCGEKLSYSNIRQPQQSMDQYAVQNQMTQQSVNPEMNQYSYSTQQPEVMYYEEQPQPTQETTYTAESTINENSNENLIDNNYQTEVQIEQPTEITNVEEAKEEKPQMVNPVSEKEVVEPNQYISIFGLIRLTFGVIFAPGTTIVEKARRYNNLKSGIYVYTVFSTIAFAVCVATKAISSCFIEIYNIGTGKYVPTLDFGQLALVNYTDLIIESVIYSYVVIILFIALYYVASFLTNKGLTIGRYFVSITLSLSPYLILSCAASPIIKIYNTSIGTGVYLFGIIYSLIILLCSMNEIIKFKNVNQKIRYHSGIIIVAGIIMYILITFFIKNSIAI